MDDALDLSALLGSVTPGPDAQAEAMRRLGTLYRMTGNRGLGAAGEDMVNEANQRRAMDLSAPQRALQTVNARRGIQEQAARESPGYANVLRQEAGRYGLNIPDNTPPAVLEHALDRAEKFSQAQWMAQARAALHGFQMKQDSDGEMVRFDPVSGTVYHEDGSLKRGGLRAPLSRGLGQPPARPAAPAAPSPAEAPDEGGPMSPTLVTASDATPPPRRGLVAPRPKPQGPLLRAATSPAQDTAPVPAAAPPATAEAPAAPSGQKLYGKRLRDAQAALGKDFDTNSGTGEIAANQKRLNAALRLKALVTNPDGSVKDFIPPQFMTETAMALAQLVNSGGQPAQSLVEELTPRTGSSKVADMLQWITAHPQDAGQQAFVKLYLESAEREAKVAQQAMDKAVAGRVGKHAAFVRGNPEDAKAVLEPQGWTLDDKFNVVRKPTADEHASKPAGGDTIKVKRKSDGKVGKMPAANFNPDLYEKL